MDKNMDKNGFIWIYMDKNMDLYVWKIPSFFLNRSFQIPKSKSKCPKTDSHMFVD